MLESMLIDEYTGSPITMLSPPHILTFERFGGVKRDLA